jgi:hypothetical protein
MNADQGFRRAPRNLLRVAAGAGAAALIVTAASAARRRSARAERDSGPARGRQVPPQAAPGTSPSPAAPEAPEAPAAPEAPEAPAAPEAPEAPAGPEAVEACHPAAGQVAISAALLFCHATALSAVAGRRRIGGKRGCRARQGNRKPGR